MGFGTRQTTSNDPPEPTSDDAPYASNELVDRFAAKLNNMLRRCQGPCGRPTLPRYLDKNNRCPDCRPADETA